MSERSLELEEGAVVAVREVEIFAVGVLGGGVELDDGGGGPRWIS